MNRLQAIKITLLIVILAEEIKRVKRNTSSQNELLDISAHLVSDYNKKNSANLLEYSARLLSRVNN